MFRSLRVRMALSHGGVMAVILLVLGTTGQALLAQSLDRSATNQVLAVAQSEADRLAEAGVTEQPSDSDVPSLQAVRVAVFTPSGRSAEPSESIPSWLLPQPQRLVDVTAHGERVRVATIPVRVGGRLIGRVVAGRSLEPEEALVHRVRFLLVFGGLAAVAASMAAGWWLAGRAARPVRHAYKVQANFAADASHELRTPLAFVRSGVEELAVHDPGLGNEVLGEIDYLTSLIERLLLLARADSNTLALSAERLDVADLCLEAVRRSRGAHGLAVTLEPGKGVSALADRTATEAALDALLENVAVHGGGKATVRWGREGDEAFIEVEDHGRGLPPQNLPSAFGRFFRADPARSRSGGGAGLGLPIARALVETQAGTVALAETPGGGITARITLPTAD